MSQKTKLIWLVLVTLLLVTMPNGYAQAYLDPGSGSLIIQLVIAALLGLAVTVRIFWTNILVWFHIKKRAEKSPDDDEPA